MNLTETILLLIFLLIVLTFYLKMRRGRRNKRSPFGNTFDFTKIPNTSIHQKKKDSADR